MAVGSEGDYGKRMERAFYDPFYVYRGESGTEREKKKLFDDFSVANHVHILRPQSVSVDVNSVVENNSKASRTRDAQIVGDAQERHGKKRDVPPAE